MINERRLYRKNQAGYLFVLLYIVCNALYSVFTLNAMDADRTLGAFVMLTILLMLLGFLTAVKVRVYSFGWSCAAVVLGIFQVIRLVSGIPQSAKNLPLPVSLLLIASGLFCLTGGVISAVSSRLRKRSLEDSEDGS